MANQQLCKKLIFNNNPQKEQNTILLGLVIAEDSLFITFKTARKQYQINKTHVILIEETKIPFEASGKL